MLPYQHKGNVSEAISDYSEAIRPDASYADAYVNRAKAYLRTANYTNT